MGKTISVYIDDDLLVRLKSKNIPTSKAIRIALKEWLDREVNMTDYDYIEKNLSGKLTSKGKKAWKELRSEKDRW